MQMSTRHKLELAGYGLLGVLAVVLDRVTKNWVLDKLDGILNITDYLSFEFVLNRGISWGMFSSDSEGTFLLIAAAVSGLVLFLISFARERFKHDHLIFGEVLVLAGALSNLFDRFMYRGVVDFIVFSYQSWTFPAFNVADMCVVSGVFIMLISVHLYPD